MNYLVVILISVIAGAINGMFSTGAGLVLIPILVFILKQDELNARGTAMFIILVMSIINLLIYSHTYTLKPSDMYIIVGGIVGSVIGNIVVNKINKNFLSIFFAFFTIIMGIGLIK